MDSRIRKRGRDAQILFELEKAVYHARILLALQLTGDHYTSDLAKMLGLTINQVAFALHEMEKEGVVAVAARNVRSETHNRINLWTATRPADYVPEGGKAAKRKIAQAAAPIEADLPEVDLPAVAAAAASDPKRLPTGVTLEDLEYQAYWRLPKEERKKRPMPPACLEGA